MVIAAPWFSVSTDSSGRGSCDHRRRTRSIRRPPRFPTLVPAAKDPVPAGAQVALPAFDHGDLPMAPANTFSSPEDLIGAIEAAGAADPTFFGYPMREDGLYLQQDAEESASFVQFMA